MFEMLNSFMSKGKNLGSEDTSLSGESRKNFISGDKPCEKRINN